MKPVALPIIYQISPQVIIENFEDGALALRLVDRQLVELDQIAHDIISFTNGKRNNQDVAKIIAEKNQLSEEQALDEVNSQYDGLVTQNIVNQLKTSQRKDGVTMTQVSAPLRYLCNPDVVLREEDEDGGLLFNPDTNQVKVINTTGLFIWKQCQVGRILDDIVNKVQKGFEDAPVEQVAEDVREFVDEMVGSGFIGTLETEE